MSKSMVQQLSDWLSSREPRLTESGLRITNRIPDQLSTIPWKGTIGLEKGDILVSYTVWDRTVFQTELIVVDSISGETLVSNDDTPDSPAEIDGILDAVAEKLIAGSFRIT